MTTTTTQIHLLVPSASTAPPQASSVHATVSLAWPYSSSTQSCALLLSEPDVRLRTAKGGQVRVRFRGAAASALRERRVRVGEEVVLGLEGAKWVGLDGEKNGRGVGGELEFARRLRLRVLREDGEVEVDVAGDEDEEEEVREEVVVADATPAKKRTGSWGASPGVGIGAPLVFASPAFFRRAGLSEGLGGGLFTDDDEEEDELRGKSSRKRMRISFGEVRDWRYTERSPSPVKKGRVEEDEVDSMNDPSEIVTGNGEVHDDDEEQHTQTPVMPPPPLPRLQMPSTRLESEILQAEEDEEARSPTTPRLHPVSSTNLPMPSPFPNDIAQPLLSDVLGQVRPNSGLSMQAQDTTLLEQSNALVEHGSIESSVERPSAQFDDREVASSVGDSASDSNREDSPDDGVSFDEASSAFDDENHDETRDDDDTIMHMDEIEEEIDPYDLEGGEPSDDDSESESLEDARSERGSIEHEILPQNSESVSESESGSDVDSEGDRDERRSYSEPTNIDREESQAPTETSVASQYFGLDGASAYDVPPAAPTPPPAASSSPPAIFAAYDLRSATPTPQKEAVVSETDTSSSDNATPLASSPRVATVPSQPATPTASAAPLIQETPPSERERVMKQTFRSLFGFRGSQSQSPPKQLQPESEALRPLQALDYSTLQPQSSEALRTSFVDAENIGQLSHVPEKGAEAKDNTLAPAEEPIAASQALTEPEEQPQATVEVTETVEEPDESSVQATVQHTSGTPLHETVHVFEDPSARQTPDNGLALVADDEMPSSQCQSVVDVEDEHSDSDKENVEMPGQVVDPALSARPSDRQHSSIGTTHESELTVDAAESSGSSTPRASQADYQADVQDEPKSEPLSPTAEVLELSTTTLLPESSTSVQEEQLLINLDDDVEMFDSFPVDPMLSWEIAQSDIQESAQLQDNEEQTLDGSIVMDDVDSSPSQPMTAQSRAMIAEDEIPHIVPKSQDSLVNDSVSLLHLDTGSAERVPHNQQDNDTALSGVEVQAEDYELHGRVEAASPIQTSSPTTPKPESTDLESLPNQQTPRAVLDTEIPHSTQSPTEETTTREELAQNPSTEDTLEADPTPIVVIEEADFKAADVLAPETDEVDVIASQISEAPSVAEQTQQVNHPKLPMSPSLSQSQPEQIVPQPPSNDTEPSALPPTPQLTQRESTLNIDQEMMEERQQEQGQDVLEEVEQQRGEEDSLAREQVEGPVQPQHKDAFAQEQTLQQDQAEEQDKAEVPGGPREQEQLQYTPGPSTTRTPVRRSLRSRLSNVPDVISAWFSPKSTSINRADQQSRLRQDVQPEPKPEVQPDVLSGSQPNSKSPDVEATTIPATITKEKLDTEMMPEEPIARRLRSASGLHTSHAYFTSLGSLEEQLNPGSQQAFGPNTVDVLGVVTDESTAAERAKGGQRDYFTALRTTDPSLKAGSSIRIEVFRPWKAFLPNAEVGDVVLLRGFVVKSRRRQPYLLSAASSAWCVWRFSEHHVSPSKGSKTSRVRKRSSSDVREEIKGPPVEYGEEERSKVSILRNWWLSSHHTEQATDSQSAAEGELDHAGQSSPVETEV